MFGGTNLTILGCVDTLKMLRGELAQRLGGPGGPSITSEGALLSGLAMAGDGKRGVLMKPEKYDP